jgi:hypothetical protein
MKIFDSKEGLWSTKVNFVDQNNLLVGFDTTQCCCENADWFISTEREYTDSPSNAVDTTQDFSAYVFDPTFFDQTGGDPRCFGSGGIAVFRLTAEGVPDLYLHLFNVHNGYYAHGFSMKDANGNLIQAGDL